MSQDLISSFKKYSFYQMLYFNKDCYHGFSLPRHYLHKHILSLFLKKRKKSMGISNRAG